MPHGIHRYGRTCVGLAALAFAVVGFAGAASAQQQVCITVDDGLPDSPPLLYRLTVTLPGNNTVSVVGTARQSPAVRVVTGGGAVVGGIFELSLRSTDINTPQQGGEVGLVNHTTHIVLNGPAFTSGSFRSAHSRYFHSGAGIGEILNLTDGSATVVACPPQG